MATDIQKLFINLGLSQSETKAYLASVKLGPTSVQEIAKAARLSRTATYDAIKSLQNYGLMSSHDRGKKTFFMAEDPERAVGHFKERIHNMQEQLETLNRVLPEIKMMAGGERPVVRFYEGNEALFALFNDVSKVAPKSLDEVSNLDDVKEYLDEKYLSETRKIVAPGKIRTRILHCGSGSMKPREHVQYCELIPDLGEFHGDIWIYADRVVFVTFIGKMIGVIIESQTFADTARVLFEAAWRVCTAAHKTKQ